jgi:hypothetical protein
MDIDKWDSVVIDSVLTAIGNTATDYGGTAANIAISD